MSEFERQMLEQLAFRRGVPMTELLRERERIEAQRDARPDIEYRNGVMFVNGERANDELRDTIDNQNPYRPESWVAKPGDRPVTPEQQALEEKRQQLARDLMRQRQNDMPGKQSDYFGVPIIPFNPNSPVIRNGAMPPRGVSIEQTTVSAIPAAKSSGNPSAGAGAGLRGTLSKVAGNVTTRTGTPRR